MEYKTLNRKLSAEILSENRPPVDVDILLEQLKKLSRDERILTGLYFHEKLSIQEISTVLDWKIDKVKTMLVRIVPRLFCKPVKKKIEESPFLELFG